MSTSEEDAARATILQRLEGEKEQNSDKQRKLLQALVNSVISADPFSLPSPVLQARTNLMASFFGKGVKQ